MFNHDVATIRRARDVVGFAGSNYGDIVGRVDPIKIVSPSRKRKSAIKAIEFVMVVRRIQFRCNVTHASVTPADGKCSKIPICCSHNESSKVEVVRFELIVWFSEA